MTADAGRPLFRAMTADGDGRRLDASARTLGARLATDVLGDASDERRAGRRGMSASGGDPMLLPSHLRLSFSRYSPEDLREAGARAWARGMGNQE